MDAITGWDIVGRLLAAAVSGAIIGWERESRGRPAGFRTTILACTAAAAAMVISDVLYAGSASELRQAGANWRPDPARLGAGILTGIGFLGAGTIIRNENLVRGVTTAASLWYVTVMGLAFGSGQFAVGIIGMGVAVMTLFALPAVERHISSDWYATLKVDLVGSSISPDELLNMIRSKEVRVTAMRKSLDVLQQHRSLEIEIKCKRPQRFELCNRLVEDIGALQGVLRVSWS